MPQYFTGEQWTDSTIRAWIAGIFDRAGSIIVRPELGRLALTVTARDPWALHAMRDLFQTGDIDPHPKIAALHVWRVKDPEGVRIVLDRLGEFLNTKRDAAQSAMVRIDEVVKRRARRAERDRQILRLRELDLYTQTQIAELTGTTPHIVSNVIARWRRQNKITIHRGKNAAVDA